MNFARSELTDAQRADHHVRREEILVRKGQAAKPGRGGDRSNGQNVRSYSKQASETLGVDERTVRRDLARGKNITPDVLAEVAGTDLDKGVVLDARARLEAAIEAGIALLDRMDGDPDLEAEQDTDGSDDLEPDHAYAVGDYADLHNQTEGLLRYW